MSTISVLSSFEADGRMTKGELLSHFVFLYFFQICLKGISWEKKLRVEGIERKEERKKGKNIKEGVSQRIFGTLDDRSSHGCECTPKAKLRAFPLGNG